MDRENLIRHLEETSVRFVRTVNAILPDCWHRSPDGGGWSPEEAAEHLVLTETALARLLREKFPKIEPVDGNVEDTTRIDTLILERGPDRTPGRRRFPAPEWLQPSGIFGTPKEAVEAFRTARAEVLEFVRRTDCELRRRRMPHPAFGNIDGCQWVLFLAAHCERHVRQIEESVVGVPPAHTEEFM